MLFFYSLLAIFINFAASGINCVELLNNHTASETTVAAIVSSNTENDLNLLTFENLQTIAANAANASHKRKNSDFNSLAVENFSTTPANLGDRLESSTATLNDLNNVETTPSWELIYPETTSTLEPVLSSSYAPLTSPLTPKSFAPTLPKYFKVDDVINCEKFFGQCLRQVLSKVVPKLKDGSRSLNVPSLDPIYFNATAFQYNSGPFTGFITIRYALIYGLTGMKFKTIAFHKQNDKFKARLNISVPKLSVIGSYKGDMHVNNVRVRPRGDFNLTIMGLDIDFLSLGAILGKEDHTFLKFTKSNATTTLKESKINATGVFPDQRLNDIVVNVANQYWRELITVVLPETRNNWLPILMNVLNAALEMVPFDFFAIKSSTKN